MEVEKIIGLIVCILTLFVLIFLLIWLCLQQKKKDDKEHKKKMQLYVRMEETLYAVERLAKKRIEVIDYYNDIQGDNNG